MVSVRLYQPESRIKHLVSHQRGDRLSKSFAVEAEDQQAQEPERLKSGALRSIDASLAIAEGFVKTRVMERAGQVKAIKGFVDTKAFCC